MTTAFPKEFTDQRLQDRAASYRAKTVCCRMPAHILAFKTRGDSYASVQEREEAEVLITSLLEYCRLHWNNYVCTIIQKKREHTFPLKCLSCGETTRWQRYSMHYSMIQNVSFVC